MVDQAELLHECFDCVQDPPVGGRTTHPLNSILFLVVAAVIADADGPEEIECFGRERLEWLSKFADFTNGIPSHDTISRVLSLMKPAESQEALITWHNRLCEQSPKQESDACESPKPIHLAIAGKTASVRIPMQISPMHCTSFRPGPVQRQSGKRSGKVSARESVKWRFATI